MPRTQPEYGARTHGRRVYPLRPMIENAGLLAIDPPAFQKVNLIQGAPSGNTINDTLTDPVQGQEILPIPQGYLGGAVYVLKAAGIAGAPVVPLAYNSQPAGPANPYDAAWDDIYVADELPLGINMHDLAGSPRDGVGGPESDLTANYYDQQGAYLDLLVFETHTRQFYVDGDLRAQAGIGNHINTPLVYEAGDKLFVDIYSGLLTNRLPISVISADAVTAGLGAAPLVNAFVVATMSRSYGDFGFDPAHVINGVLPVPVAEVVDVPTSEYRALRVKTLL